MLNQGDESTGKVMPGLPSCVMRTHKGLESYDRRVMSKEVRPSGSALGAGRSHPGSA